MSEIHVSLGSAQQKAVSDAFGETDVFGYGDFLNILKASEAAALVESWEPTNATGRKAKAKILDALQSQQDQEEQEETDVNPFAAAFDGADTMGKIQKAYNGAAKAAREAGAFGEAERKQLREAQQAAVANLPQEQKPAGAEVVRGTGTRGRSCSDEYLDAWLRKFVDHHPTGSWNTALRIFRGQVSFQCKDHKPDSGPGCAKVESSPYGIGDYARLAGMLDKIKAERGLQTTRYLGTKAEQAARRAEGPSGPTALERRIKAAVALLEEQGYTVTAPEAETEQEQEQEAEQVA